MKPKKLLLALALLLLIPSLVLAAGAVRMQQNQAALAQHHLNAQELNGLLAAHDHLSKTLPFWEQGGACDAGRTLNPALALEDSSYPAQSPPWWADMDWPREGAPGKRSRPAGAWIRPPQAPTGTIWTREPKFPP